MLLAVVNVTRPPTRIDVYRTPESKRIGISCMTFGGHLVCGIDVWLCELAE